MKADESGSRNRQAESPEALQPRETDSQVETLIIKEQSLCLETRREDNAQENMVMPHEAAKEERDVIKTSLKRSSKEIMNDRTKRIGKQGRDLLEITSADAKEYLSKNQ